MPTKTQISTHKLQLDERLITYKLKQSWRTRHIRLTIHPQHGLTISAPKLYSRTKIEKFILEKKHWIINKLTIQQHKQKNIFRFTHQALITLLGTDYQIKITNTKDIRTQILFPTQPNKNLQNFQTLLPQKTDFYLPITIKTPLSNAKTAEQYFFKWLKEFTKQTIENKVNYYAKKHNIKFNRITVKNQQTLWGSCSAKQNLNFSKRLIQAPLWLIDYVICHELAHLTHMNHSQQFWNKVKEYYPECKKARRHLKNWTPHIIIC